LDKIHPVVSGNKLFKLYYFLEEAIQSERKTLLTFGGTYSNHLVATAFACREYGLNAIAVVRGEQPRDLSPTLQHCKEYGMQLKFISRELYAHKEDPLFLAKLQAEFGACTIVPEGGYHPTGARGASLINQLAAGNYSHVCTALGTATTMAGLLLGSSNNSVIAVPVLKGMTDIEERVNFLCGDNAAITRLQILDNYHFGGYAKMNSRLIDFMNRLWQQQHLPTDFVYTAKLFFAVYDKIENNYFAAGSKILCVHTGGLQGNLSLPAGTLLF
jgi:1-aminocyclopropane-1-carboxylate deaminase/D-cysteine desulfhydrase-like pyridoxal-dependent ACC family enzyme